MIRGAAQQLPILVILWYIMKELKAENAVLKKDVADLKSAVATETQARLEATNEELRRRLETGA